MSDKLQLFIKKVKNLFKKKEKTEKENKPKLFDKYFSRPLLKQSIKSNRTLWLILSIGSALIFVIINLAIGRKQIFTNINMNLVSQYVKDENMSWLQILGLLDIMGFNLNRIQVMSQVDLNSVMSDLIYKIAGVLLPMIYVMITGNKLLASQVNDGSMAYVLSTPTARKKVVRTQYLYLSVSLALMYIIITLGAFISGLPGCIATNAMPVSTYTLRTILFCFASFCSIFMLTGICFGASGFFNKSSKSIAVGGGACVLAFICCILGLFANKVFIAVGVGVPQMDIFNYISVFSLIDTDSMSSFCKAATHSAPAEISYAWIWKDAIALILGGLIAFAGGWWFTKKDLPL